MVADTEVDRSSVQRVKFCKSYYLRKAGFIEVKKGINQITYCCLYDSDHT